EKYGDRPRAYRNGLSLAVPAADQVEVLRRAVRYLIAAEGVKAKAKQLNLTDEQKGQLRERESTERAAAESALMKLYTAEWFLGGGGGVVRGAKVAGGRPRLKTTCVEKKKGIIR